MKILLVYSHPNPESFNAALRDAALEALRGAGHEVHLLDLYAEGFNPVLSRAERETYIASPQVNAAALQSHIDLLGACEGIVFVFPTWMYGPPAMLKGWLERTLLPGYAFTIPKKKGERPGSLMRHIRFVAGITTSGSPWWWFALMGNPARITLMRGLGILFSSRCRKTWLQLYNINNATAADRSGFLTRISKSMGAVR